MSSDPTLFASAPFDQGAECACCQSREHATAQCPYGEALTFDQLQHEETHAP